MAKLFTSPIIAITCLFYLFSSTALAASAVLGVDLGTEYIKAALVKPGIPLEIVLTKDSRRKEMSAVTFKPSKNIKSGEFPERLYGSDAMALSARFPQDVYPNLKTLLGLTTENTLVKEYASRHPALSLESDKTRGTAAFKSKSFAEDEQAWTVEEILAMELQSIQKNAEALAGRYSGSIQDLVITVPAFYTAEEKRAILLAADLAGLRVLELVSDGLAVGLNYATTRTFPSVNEGGKPEHHMVFDMGAGSTKATILKFQGRTVKDVGRFNKTIQEVQVLGSGWDRTLGGDALNAIIVDDMIAQFVASPAAKSVSPTVESVKAHGRAVAKLWKEAERLRQILSANAHTKAGFEGLYEDVDFRYKLTRAQFETLAEPYAARIATAIQNALDIAEMAVADLDSVILNGGATRTPFVQKALEKLIGNAEKIRTNVNSDEAAVFGAGFRGAVLSPSFRVKDIRASEGAAYAASMKWTSPKGKSQTQKLWKPTSFLGAEKQYTFKNHDDFSVDFFQVVPSSENVSPGPEEKDLITITTQNLTETVSRLKDKFGCADSDIYVKMTTRLSPSDGEVEVTKFTADCEVDKEKAGVVDSIKGAFGFGKKDQEPLVEEGEEKTTSTVTDDSSSTSSSSASSASAKASKDAKAKPIPPTKRIEVIPILFTKEIKGAPRLPDAELTRMKDRISAFEESDKARRLREEALNQLEGFTYKVRELLDNEDFVAVSTAAERENLETLRSDASDWIYAGGSDATREELKAKFKAIKEAVSPIQKRQEEAAERPAKIKELQEGLKDTQGVIDRVTEQITKEEAAIESWSSSKSASSSATTTSVSSEAASESSAAPSESSVPAGEFEGLEDEEATTTTSAPVEIETEVPPTIYFSAEELAPLQKLHDEMFTWLTTQLAEQEKLSATENPSLLVINLEDKIKELQDARIDVVVRSLKTTPPKPKKTASKKSKPKSSKTKKGKKTKTDAAPKGAKTLNIADLMGENGEMPSDEEIKAYIEKATGQKYESSAAGEAAEAGEAGEAVTPEKESEPSTEAKADSAHDEL